MERPWTLKIELSPSWENNFHEKWSEKRPPGRDDFVTPFASELVLWRRQLAQIRALADPRCKKRAQPASRRLTNWSKTRKNTEKPAWKVPRKDPALKKSARALCEAAKTQGNIINESGRPENTGRASEKAREEQRATSCTKTKEHTRYRNLCALIASRWGAFL